VLQRRLLNLLSFLQGPNEGNTERVFEKQLTQVGMDTAAMRSALAHPHQPSHLAGFRVLGLGPSLLILCNTPGNTLRRYFSSIEDGTPL
jgi:hypothetical protein